MRILAWLATAIVSFASGYAFAQDSGSITQQVQALHWVRSPQSFGIAGVAHIALMPGLKALGTLDTDRFLQLQGNLPSTDDYTVSEESYKWFSVFSFDPSGHVKDDEQIDPAQFLSTLTERNREDVEKKKKAGLDPLYIDGWFVEPHYDIQSHRLEWGDQFHDAEGQPVINYSSRILGRSGVIAATLVSSPDTLRSDLLAFHAMIDHLSFDQGQKYAEFRDGDKVAAYGLGALVVGGAAAAAVKVGGGALKGIAYAAFAVVAGFFTWLKSLFSRRKSNK